MRLLGIDYGTKRVGLAYGDELGVATPLPALLTADPAVRRARLGELVKQRRIQALVVGYPLNMDGTTGPRAREVDAFIAELERTFALPVHRMDERLTSHAAESTMSSRERRDARQTGIVDSRAAAIILQDHLDQRLLAPPLPPATNDDAR